MAPKAPSSLSHQPSKEKQEKDPPSSSEDDDNDSDETEEGSLSEDEEEQDQQKLKNNKTPIPIAKFDSKSTTPKDGSDSDSDSEDSPSDYKLQPISKPSSSAAPAKRAHQEGDDATQNSSRSSKKSRSEEKKPLPSTPGGGAGCITRLWSDEDEISVLNGMVEFKNVKGLDPHSDMGAFHDFIKGKLQADFSRDQLRTKIKRLKTRFLNALKKCEDGSDPVFSKPHEDMSFELSKKIWGGAVGGNEGGKKGEQKKKDIVKAKKVVVDEKVVAKEEKGVEGRDFWSKYPSFSESFRDLGERFPSLAMLEAQMSFVKERLSLIGNAKAKELDEKWKQLIVEEAELNYKMLSLMTEQVKMAFDQ